MLLLAALTAWGKEFDPHRQAQRCRQQWKPDCDRVCALCHPTPDTGKSHPARIDEVYADMAVASAPAKNWGDLLICLQCHPEHGASSDAVAVSTLQVSLQATSETGSGNHPVDILYPLGDPGYHSDPQGATIYCDEFRTECWVYCTSCHDMHSANGPVPPYEICPSCHIK